MDDLREHLSKCQGRVVDLQQLRHDLELEKGTPAWDGIRTCMHRLVPEKIVMPYGKKDGVFKVIKRVQPVRVFEPGRERRPLFNLTWITDTATGEEISIGRKIVTREGDLISLGGVKSKGKTTLCMGMTASNIALSPVLMGNEYTVLVDGKYEPAPRFLSRLDTMSEWVNWTDKDGYDRFTLMPVKEDYAEHIERDRLNIIDWINLDGDKSYDISKVLEGIKSSLGKGVGIVALQKGEGAGNPRGGQFVRDFSDVEILLDGYGENEDDILMTVKGCKEKTAPIVNKSFAYTIVQDGTAIHNFREVIRCKTCYGRGEIRNSQCEQCNGVGWVNK